MFDGVVAPDVGGVVVAFFYFFIDDAGGGEHDAADGRAVGQVHREGAIFALAPVGDGVADADCVDGKFFCSVAVVAFGEVEHILGVVEGYAGMDVFFHCCGVFDWLINIFVCGG